VVTDRRGRTIETTVALAAGEARVIDVEDNEDAGSDQMPLPPAVDPRYEARKLVTKRLFYSSVALTGGSGILWAVFGGLAIHERNSFESGLCPMTGEGEAECPPGHETDPERHIERFESFRLAANVTAGLTAGFAATSAILAIVAFTKPPAQPGPRASTRLRVTPGGLHLEF
jgi:hypothetical protein